MKRTNPFFLTDKQIQFVHNYLTSRDLNATRAYQAAYPISSRASARSSASRLLKTNPNINSYIQDIGKRVRF